MSRSEAITGKWALLQYKAALRDFGSWKHKFPTGNILTYILFVERIFPKVITQSTWWEGQRKERAACIRSDAAHSCGGKGLHISMDQILQLHSFVWPVHLLNLTRSQNANRDFSHYRIPNL